MNATEVEGAVSTTQSQSSAAEETQKYALIVVGSIAGLILLQVLLHWIWKRMRTGRRRHYRIMDRMVDGLFGIESAEDSVTIHWERARRVSHRSVGAPQVSSTNSRNEDEGGAHQDEVLPEYVPRPSMVEITRPQSTTRSLPSYSPHPTTRP
ncbi:hypothetical protein BDR26DRAFT_849327 [Obelidium mucronatum]|nr:hypothetical protein BDR26DRAFT_849327 [Obelidium mucronatum]